MATDDEIAELVRQTAESASAIMRGDIRRYLDLVAHADDYTLMPPNGGDTVHGFVASDDDIETMARTFRGGEADLEVVQTYTSGDLAVLVAVERQHGPVGGQPDQDWSLRITLVFRIEDGRWRLVHRHADPLVNPVGPATFAALARGELRD